ncbi:MAG TPA: Omp28-related outer membrane protein [Flavobacteriales bacterium]|nr:Omp28-related outer membrane protein [Flavobacteriales bacterium]
MTSIRTLVCSVLLVSGPLAGQSLVSTVPRPRTALLEEFTALNCGNCPGAHAVANSLAATYGDDLTIIGVHGGSLAVPSGSQPDLRSAAGAALWSQFNVTYQPQGMIARQGLQQASAWNASIQSVLAQTSPVNIGVASVFEAGEQQYLTVQVELYYTAEGPIGEDRIHVALTEDHIIGWQSDYVNGHHPDYDHRHVLRAYFTPLEGDAVTTTSTGSFVSRTYSLNIPPEWNVGELDVVAFVGEADGILHQVRSVDADGGVTLGVDANADRYQGLGAAFPLPAAEQVTIPLSTNANGVLLVRDVHGRVVLQERVPIGSRTVVLPVNDLAEGVYTYGFSNGSARLVVVAR